MPRTTRRTGTRRTAARSAAKTTRRPAAKRAAPRTSTARRTTARRTTARRTTRTAPSAASLTRTVSAQLKALEKRLGDIEKKLDAAVGRAVSPLFGQDANPPDALRRAVVRPSAQPRQRLPPDAAPPRRAAALPSAQPRQRLPPVAAAPPASRGRPRLGAHRGQRQLQRLPVAAPSAAAG